MRLWDRFARVAPYLIIPVGLYLAAVLVRLTIWQSPIYGDEGYVYTTARVLFFPVENVHLMLLDEPGSLAQWFWYRPFNYLPLTPAALISFEAWRLAHLLITSTTPVFAYLILRSLGVRPLIAAPTAAVYVVHQIFVSFGVLVFQDGLGTTFFAAALLARVQGRSFTSAGLFLITVWAEEGAIFGVLLLLGWDVARALRTGEASLWPLRLPRAQTAQVYALALAPLPVLISLFLGGQLVSHPGPENYRGLLDRLFLFLWMAPVIALGLAWRRTRLWSLLGLLYPLLYTAYFQLGRSVQIWWTLLPGFLAGLATALVLDEAWSRTWRRRNRRRFAFAPALVALFLVAVAGIHIFAPQSWPHKGELTMPASGWSEWSLGEVIDYHYQRDANLVALLDHFEPRHEESAFVVDAGWFHIWYPFSVIFDEVRYGYTGDLPATVPETIAWSRLVEDFGAVTIIKQNDLLLNRALHQTYDDCIVYENPEFVLIEGRSCAGRRDALLQAYEDLAQASP